MMSETVWRIIYVLHCVLGATGALLLCVGCLVFTEQPKTDQGRRYKRLFIRAYWVCGVYWGAWLIRWVATGLPLVAS